MRNNVPERPSADGRSPDEPRDRHRRRRCRELRPGQRGPARPAPAGRPAARGACRACPRRAPRLPKPDGGFGRALEPDIRAPESESAATFDALAVLAEIGALDDPMVGDAAAWVASIAEPDGGVPFSLPAAAAHPHAPLPHAATRARRLVLHARARGFALGGGFDEPRLERATGWPWARPRRRAILEAYGVKRGARLPRSRSRRGARPKRSTPPPTYERTVDPRSRRRRERAAHGADGLGSSGGAAEPSPRISSRPASTSSKRDSRRTADGCSTSARGRLGSWRSAADDARRRLATLDAHGRGKERAKLTTYAPTFVDGRRTRVGEPSRQDLADRRFNPRTPRRLRRRR